MLKLLAHLCNFRKEQSAAVLDHDFNANSPLPPSQERGDAATTASGHDVRRASDEESQAIETAACPVYIGSAPAPTISHDPDVRALMTRIASLRLALADRDTILSTLCNEEWVRQGSATTDCRARTTRIQILPVITE